MGSWVYESINQGERKLYNQKPAFNNLNKIHRFLTFVNQVSLNYHFRYLIAKIMNRGKSLFGSAFEQKQNLLKDEIQQKQYSKILEDLKTRPKRLKQFIVNYRKAATDKQQFQVYGDFRRQQQSYKRYREELKDELQNLQGQGPNDSEYNYVRNQLILAIKQQMNLDLQINQLIAKKKQDKQKHTLNLQNLQGKSPRVNNALKDIIQKANQIKQLQGSIAQCLQLLKIIGVLVTQQGNKIDQVEKQVSDANHFIDMAQKKIQKAKIQMERSTRKKCCVIVIGLIAICLILVVLYGINIIKI